MIPLFDSESELVGWFDGELYVYDTDMNWVAFIAGDHAWSSETGEWLGPLHGLTFLDQAGKPVAWSTKQAPSGTLPPLRPLTPLMPLAPLTPLTPLTPLQPLQPLTPLGGWSDMTWQDWISQ